MAALIFFALWKGPHDRASFPLLAVGVAWIVFLWARPRFNARRRIRDTPSARSPITLEISERELHFRSSCEDSKVAWSALVGWGEGKTVFALFPSPRTQFPVPKRAFTPEQMAEFRGRLVQLIK
jgi:hypothetical protein